MTVARRRGDAGKADLLFSRIVRSRGVCERCGDRTGPFDTAHIVRRRYSATRCVEANAWCACRPCHRMIDGWPDVFMNLVDLTIGRDQYEELCRDAHEGIPLSSKLWWAAERERLEARCTELGIDTKWRAA